MCRCREARAVEYLKFAISLSAIGSFFVCGLILPATVVGVPCAQCLFEIRFATLVHRSTTQHLHTCMTAFDQTSSSGKGIIVCVHYSCANRKPHTFGRLCIDFRPSIMHASCRRHARTHVCGLPYLRTDKWRVLYRPKRAPSDTINIYLSRWRGSSLCVCAI